MVPWARLTFGSCNSVHNMWCHDLTQECVYLPQPMWPHITARQPQAWIWLGDAIYSDYIESWSDIGFNTKLAYPERLRELYHRQHQNEGYKAMINSGVRVLGTWDDHDMGMNNGDSSYPYLKESGKAFREFIGGEFPNNGMHTSHRFDLNGVDTHVILLDIRSFRSSRQDPNGSFLGEEQWRWFDARLQEKADLVVVGSAIQVLALHRTSVDVEGWPDIPHERERLLRQLSAVNTTYVPLIISGDVHFADIWDAGCMIEFTSSGLTHSTGDSRHVMGAESGVLWQELWAMYTSPFYVRMQVALSRFLQPSADFTASEKTFAEISVEERDSGEIHLNLYGVDGLLTSRTVPRKTGSICTFPEPLPQWRVVFNWFCVVLYTYAPTVATLLLISLVFHIRKKLPSPQRHILVVCSILPIVCTPGWFSFLFFGSVALTIVIPKPALIFACIGCIYMYVIKQYKQRYGHKKAL